MQLCKVSVCQSSHPVASAVKVGYGAVQSVCLPAVTLCGISCEGRLRSCAKRMFASRHTLWYQPQMSNVFVCQQPL